MARKRINPPNKTARGTQNCTSRNIATHHVPLLPYCTLRFSLIKSAIRHLPYTLGMGSGSSSRYAVVTGSGLTADRMPARITCCARNPSV